MKKLLLTAVLACLVIAPAAHAAKGEFTFGLNGGISSPTGDYGKTDVNNNEFGFKSGFNGGVFGDYMVHELVGVGVDASYAKNDSKDWNSGDDGKVTILQFGGHVKVMPAMKDISVSPYLQVGAGLYRAKTETTISNVSTDDTVNKFGYNIGAGVDYKVNPMFGLGVFGTFHSALDAFEKVDVNNNVTKKAANYVTAGIKLTFMTTGSSSAGDMKN
jgi:opacity protein-like surface antigen